MYGPFRGDSKGTFSCVTVIFKLSLSSTHAAGARKALLLINKSQSIGIVCRDGYVFEGLKENKYLENVR
jgi:hypothetical protein